MEFENGASSVNTGTHYGIPDACNMQIRAPIRPERVLETMKQGAQQMGKVVKAAGIQPE